ESLALFRALDDPMGIAHNLIDRAYCDIQLGNYDDARPFTEEALQRARAVGDTIIEGLAELQLGNYCLYAHDFEQARTHFKPFSSLWRSAHFAAMSHSLALAVIEMVLGHFEQAEILCRELLLHPGQHQLRMAYLDSVLAVVLASIAQRRGQFEHAARL